MVRVFALAVLALLAPLEGGGVMFAAKQIYLGRSAKAAPTAKSYVQDGLIAMWDGIENAGWGVHDAAATTWKDLISGIDFTFGSGMTWGTDYATTAGSEVVGTLNKSNTSLFGRILGASAQGNFEYCLAKGIDTLNPYWTNGSSQGILFYLRMLNNMVAVRNQNGAMNGAGSFFWNTRMTKDVLHTMAFSMASGEKCKLYVDGEYKESSSANCNFAVNLLSTGNYAMQFKIRQEKTHCVRVYSRALSADELAANSAIDKERFNLP